MSQPAAATLVVNLPANAKLTVDGKLTTLTSASRRFATPPLQPGKTYVYTLQAEVEIDGRVSTVTKDVTVEAGKETRTSLTLPVGIASK